MGDMRESDFFDTEAEAFDTVMESDISFSGSLRFAKPFMIRGKLDGKIDATGALVVDSGAEVRADIRARSVLVKGKVKGDVTADEIVFVSSTGVLEGDIKASRVALEPGCVFSGRCAMAASRGEKST